MVPERICPCPAVISTSLQVLEEPPTAESPLASKSDGLWARCNHSAIVQRISSWRARAAVYMTPEGSEAYVQNTKHSTRTLDVKSAWKTSSVLFCNEAPRIRRALAIIELRSAITYREFSNPVSNAFQNDFSCSSLDRSTEKFWVTYKRRCSVALACSRTDIFKKEKRRKWILPWNERRQQQTLLAPSHVKTWEADTKLAKHTSTVRWNNFIHNLHHRLRPLYMYLGTAIDAAARDGCISSSQYLWWAQKYGNLVFSMTQAIGTYTYWRPTTRTKRRSKPSKFDQLGTNGGNETTTAEFQLLAKSRPSPIIEWQPRNA